MNRQKTIQKFYSFFLLLIFSFSAIPKIYFHDVIANHKDTIAVCDHPEKVKTCLHQAAYHCHTDELVVNTPYLILRNVTALEVTAHFPEFNSSYHFSISRNCLIHKESRGPPTV